MLLDCFSHPPPYIAFLFLIIHAHTGGSRSFFKDVQPKAIKALLAATREKVDLLVATTVSSATAATNEGRKQMSDVGLPGSLETYKTGGLFPENLWLEIERVQMTGGIAELLQRYSDLEISATHSHSTIGEIEESVNREERVDQAFHSRFQEWGAGGGSSMGSGVPSDVLNADIKVW